MTVIFMSALMAAAQVASPSPAALAAPRPVEKRTRPSADEPAAVEFSLKRAADQMDTAALSWTGNRSAVPATPTTLTSSLARCSGSLHPQLRTRFAPSSKSGCPLG